VLSMGYLDTVKRLLVWGDQTSIMDVTIILAFAPLLAGAVFAGVIVRDVLGNEFTRERLRLAVVVTVMVTFAAFLVFVGGLGGGNFGKLRSIANYAGYMPLIYVVPRLFGTEEQVMRMLKAIVLIFVPVALYTFKQYFWGYAWWEIAYLQTGLSLEVRAIEGQDFRYFSTLNSSQNLSKVAAMLGVLALVLPWNPRSKFISRCTALALAVLFAGAAFCSGARTGIVMGLAALVFLITFRKRFLTAAMYGTIVAAFVFLTIVSDHWLEEKTLNEASLVLVDLLPFIREERLNLATFSSRLESFSNLKDPEFWTPFGIDKREYQDYYVHDAFTRLLMRVGYIPIMFAAAVGGYLLMRMHGAVFRAARGRGTMLTGLSLAMCILVGGISASENLSTFPISAFLYLFAGVVVVGLRAAFLPVPVRRDEEARPAPEGRPFAPEPVRLR